jgi:SAM-dependent methyltransferase
MNTTEEFREVIEGNYGIKDIPTYEEYKRNRCKDKGGVSAEEIDRMSPDNPNFNSCSFWEYIDKNPQLKYDAIAYGKTGEATAEDVNFHNLHLAVSCNILTYFWPLRVYKDLPILDIGAGYGMLRDFVQKNTAMKYYGVDVYPKFEGCLQVGPDGYTLPEEVMKQKFGLVVSTNVFQHLSVNQRRKYYEQIEKILWVNGGIFTLGISAYLAGHPAPLFINKDKPDKGYNCHYGQYLEIQPVHEIHQDLAKHFRIISICQRLEALPSFTFHCCLKEPPKPNG